VSQAIYVASVESCTALLGSLSEILAKAAVRKDAATLPAARLASDMFPLSAQVQLACYQAVAGAQRLAGREAVRPAMQEADFGALRAHIAEALQDLAMFTPDDFGGAAERQITMPLQPPMVLEVDGSHFLHRWMLPNFFFHLVTAYDILRANGLDIGKKDFMSHAAGFMHQAG
jgi:hypothetical protein